MEINETALNEKQSKCKCNDTLVSLLICSYLGHQLISPTNKSIINILLTYEKLYFKQQMTVQLVSLT